VGRWLRIVYEFNAKYDKVHSQHTPTKVLKNITPEEAWISVKSDVSHFCVFGSEAWAHVPN
jgi:hypothetical protein